MAYDYEIKLQAKRLFVQEGKSRQEISDFFDGSPAPSTIHNWATTENSEGKTWYDLRQEYVEKLYQETSTKVIANKLIERIHQILTEEDFSTKKADALAKLQKVLRGVVEEKYHLSMFYQVMTDYLEFCQEQHPDLVDEPFIESIRDFKNEVRSRLT